MAKLILTRADMMAAHNGRDVREVAIDHFYSQHRAAAEAADFVGFTDDGGERRVFKGTGRPAWDALIMLGEMEG